MRASTYRFLSLLCFLAVFLLQPSLSMACECIASGETKSSDMQFDGETHCYSFWSETGQGVVIEMARLSGGLDPRVQLYDPNGVLVADSGGKENDWRAIIENYQTEMTGIYTIIASDGGYNPDTGGFGLSLVLTGGTTTSPQDKDGNDVTIGHAQSGNITPGGDTDAYCFFGQVGQGVVIEMARLSGGLDPRVQLYDPNGVRVADSGGKENDWRATIENYQTEMTGIYTIVASDGGYNPDTGGYGLSVSLMPPIDPFDGIYPCNPYTPDGPSVSLCNWDNLSLWWLEVYAATSYDVYFSRGPCMPLEKVAENIVDTIIDPCAFMPAPENKHYVCSWKVVAHTPEGDIYSPTYWFAVECCFPNCHPDYNSWVEAGKPECWCYPRQCHGDSDGLKEGGATKGYYVHFHDLNILLAGWNTLEHPKGPGIATITGPYGEPGICADFAHDQEGSAKKGYYRVHFNDLNTLIANWNTLEPPQGPGIDPNCLDCP